MSKLTQNSNFLRIGKAKIEKRDTNILIYFEESIPSFDQATCQQICEHIAAEQTSITSIIWNFSHCAQLTNGARSALLEWLKNQSFENIALVSPSMGIRALLVWTVYSAGKELGNIQVLHNEDAAFSFIYPRSALAPAAVKSFDFVEIINDRRKFFVLTLTRSGKIDEQLAREIIRHIKNCEQSSSRPLIILLEHKLSTSKEAHRLFDTFFHSEDRVVIMVDKRRLWYKKDFGARFVQGHITRSFTALDKAVAWTQKSFSPHIPNDLIFSLGQLQAKQARFEKRSAAIMYFSIGLCSLLYGLAKILFLDSLGEGVAATIIFSTAIFAWFGANILNAPQKSAIAFCSISGIALMYTGFFHTSMTATFGPMVILAILATSICPKEHLLKLIGLGLATYTGLHIIEILLTISGSSESSPATTWEINIVNIISLGAIAIIAYFVRNQYDRIIDNLTSLSSASEEAIALALKQVNAYGSYNFSFQPNPSDDNPYAITLTTALTMLGREFGAHANGSDLKSASAPRPSLLAIEQNSDTKEKLEVWLKETHTLTFASSLGAAESMIEHTVFDCILIDLALVGSKDAVFWSKIATKQPQAICIGMIDADYSGDPNQLQPAAIAAKISKPITSKESLQKKLASTDKLRDAAA